MFQLHHILSPGRHAIIFRLGHSLFDAIGAFQLMHLFIAQLAQILPIESIPMSALAWGEEVSRLAGPVPDRSKVPWSEEKTEQDGEMTKKFYEALGFAQKSHGIHVPNTTASPSTTGVFLRSFSTDALSSLLSAARQHGCTIFNILLAAEILAILRVNPPTRKDEISIPIFPSPFNLRTNHLRKKPFEKANWDVAGAIACNILIARDLGQFSVNDTHDNKKLVDDVFTLAREIRAQIDEQRKYMDRASFWVHEMMSTILSVITASASRPQSGLPPDPVPNFSSLGVVDEYLGASHAISSGSHITVANPIFTVCTPYNPYFSFPLLLHPYTWGGRLYISFSFPEAYMGSVAELVEAKNIGKDGENSILDLVDEFMNILEHIAGREK